MMKLAHYSTQGIGQLRDIEKQKVHDAVKPTGLWVSVVGEMGWLDWCRDFDFRLDDWKVQQEVVLKDGVLSCFGQPGGVLHLSTPSDLSMFQEQFGTRMIPSGARQWIDWVLVASQYDGLIIAPYIWECRLDMIWYYGWDCASGCLWRPTKVVASVGEPVPVDPKSEVET